MDVTLVLLDQDCTVDSAILVKKMAGSCVLLFYCGCVCLVVVLAECRMGPTRPRGDERDGSRSLPFVSLSLASHSILFSSCVHVADAH